MNFSPLLLTHICAGTLGLLSGTVAICYRKGSRGHAVAGIVFSISMLSLAATGVWLACLKSQMDNVLGGLLTIYMVGTAWMAARRNSGGTGVPDWIALFAALAIGTACITYGVEAAGRQAGPDNGEQAGILFFGSVILIAAVGDMRVLMRGGISGVQRIARHLWRMCFGLFIVSGSFFLGRQRIFPEFVRKSNVLVLLTVLPLLLLIFWLIRVRFRNAYVGRAKLDPTNVFSAPS